jgi:hypothetical protein
MKDKHLIKIINEEISNFDFLSNEEYLKEEENYDLLKNEDFQKQFICDSLINNVKIKQHITDARVGGNWENGNDADKLTIEYFVEIEYKYDPSKEPAKFTVDFYSEQIGIGIHTQSDPGSYGNFIEPTFEAQYTDINWRDIDVSMHTPDGDEIDFLAFKKAPPTIQVLFIREYTEKFIATETADTEELKKDNIKSIPYC